MKDAHSWKSCWERIAVAIVVAVVVAAIVVVAAVVVAIAVGEEEGLKTSSCLVAAVLFGQSEVDVVVVKSAVGSCCGQGWNAEPARYCSEGRWSTG